jgi:uncharacterized protein YndB with AHSA1/START domain
MAAPYHFVTRFRMGTDRKRVWDAMVDVEAWPGWWRWLLDVRVVEEGDELGVGSVFRQQITSPLRYGFVWDVEIASVEEGARVDLASYGALEGRGRFVLASVPDGTEVAFIWLVRTGKRWMNVLEPIARPVFTWSHDRLMDDFARGLAATLDCRLVWIRHESLDPGEPGFFEMPAATA